MSISFSAKTGDSHEAYISMAAGDHAILLRSIARNLNLELLDLAFSGGISIVPDNVLAIIAELSLLKNRLHDVSSVDSSSKIVFDNVARILNFLSLHKPEANDDYWIG